MSVSRPDFKTQFDAQDVKLLASEPVFRGFVTVERRLLSHRLFATGQWSSPVTREVVKRRDAVGVIVYDPQLKQFLLIEQFRAATLKTGSPWQLELIAGLIDDGEDAVQCIRREAMEEANCQLDTLTRLFCFYPSAGVSDETYTLYAATADLSHAGGIYGKANEGEDIRVHLFDYADVEQILINYAISNASLVIALQWLHAHVVRTADLSKEG